MGLYETLKFIHIVAATVVLGGGLLLLALNASAVLNKNGERLQALSTASSWVGPRFFAPAWLLVLGFGVWATIEGNLDFGDAWITIGFVVFAVAIAMAPLHERHAKGLHAAISEHGPASSQAMVIGRRELALSTLEAGLIIFAIWAMTAKPGL